NSGLLWVLICGRLATPAVSQATWMRAMFRSTRSMSITAQGVPYSRAILAARGVVMLFSLFESVGWVERSETHQSGRGIMMGIASLHPSYRSMPALSLHAVLQAPANDPLRPRVLPAPLPSQPRPRRISCDPWRRGRDRQAAS